MTSTAHDPSGEPRWSYHHNGPGGCWRWRSWGGPRPGWRFDNTDTGESQQFWRHAHPFAGPHFVAKPLLIVAMILGFIWWWPVGLALLAVTVFARKACGYHRWAAWQATARGPGAGGKNWFGGEPPSSGNRAFDEYRTETLRRLEEEQKEFAEFLERLRFAKDKSEFDQFMGDRRNRPSGTPSEPPNEPSS